MAMEKADGEVIWENPPRPTVNQWETRDLTKPTARTKFAAIEPVETFQERLRASGSPTAWSISPVPPR